MGKHKLRPTSVFYVRGDSKLIKEFKKQAVEENLSYCGFFEKVMKEYLRRVRNEGIEQFDE